MIKKFIAVSLISIGAHASNINTQLANAFFENSENEYISDCKSKAVYILMPSDRKLLVNKFSDSLCKSLVTSSENSINPVISSGSIPGFISFEDEKLGSILFSNNLGRVSLILKDSEVLLEKIK